MLYLLGIILGAWIGYGVGEIRDWYCARRHHRHLIYSWAKSERASSKDRARGMTALELEHYKQPRPRDAHWPGLKTYPRCSPYFGGCDWVGLNERERQ